MGIRADRKKMARKFKVGDVVTWGCGLARSEIIEIDHTGVYVKDETTKRHFVPFAPGPKYGEIMEPLRLVSRGMT